MLLALDIAVRVSPREAVGQEPEIRLFPEPPVRPASVSMQVWDPVSVEDPELYVVRLWSDGTTEVNRRSPNPDANFWFGWQTVPEVP